MDNPYLPKSELDKILMKKDKPGFENWWKVYGLGELGSLEGVVFQNVRYEKEGEVSEAFRILPTGYAMDFGFHPDPDVLIKVAINEKEKKIYAHEVIYKSGLGIQELSDLIGVEIPDKIKSIIADSASPRMIFDLGKRFNIKAVIKPGVIESIRALQEYEIIISDTSYNFMKETQNYIWSDKKAGIPFDAWNHCWDALRYYQTSHTSLRIPTKIAYRQD
jgi:phage terminase large subunit